MKEMGLQAWKWIAVGVLMGILTLLMVTGLGTRRGTWLNGLRLTLWALVMGLSGATAGCSGKTQIGTPDARPDMTDPEPDFGCVECYVAPMEDPPPDAPTDPVVEPEPDFSCVECYAPPWDPGPDAPEDPVEDDVPEDEESDD